MSQFRKLAPEVKANPNLRWDEATGVIYDRASGKPFAGDIDLVYIRDAKTNELVGGARYQRIADRLGASRAMTRHGAEVNSVSDITRLQGPGATDDAMQLHGSLSPGHETGAETVIYPDITDQNTPLEMAGIRHPPGLLRFWARNRRRLSQA